MHDIFLSYASEDHLRAGQLADALGKLGWKVWWDRTILPGKTFDKVIESELTAATCVIVLWSKTSVESQWVRAEAGEALKQDRLIPALLEDVEIPLVFRQIQAAALLDWEGSLDHAGFTQLTRAITAFVAPSQANDTPADIVSAEIKPDTAESEQPGHQPASGQSKPGGHSTSLFWPAATIGALLIASFSIYLNWKKPAVTEVPVAAEVPVDPAIQTKRSDRGDEILNAARSKPEPAIKKDSRQPPAPQVSTEPRESEPATEPDIKPSPRVVKPGPVVPQVGTPATTIATTTPPQTNVPEPPPLPVNVLMVVWGMPNDEGLASPTPVREYSGKLAEMMTGAVQDVIRRPVKFDYRYIKDRNHHSLMRDEPEYEQSSALCREAGVDLLIIGFVEGSEFDDSMGYLPTRPSFFSVFHCKSGKGVAKNFEVAATLDDSFPYENSLTRVFRSFSQQELPEVGYL